MKSKFEVPKELVSIPYSSVENLLEWCAQLSNQHISSQYIQNNPAESGKGWFVNESLLAEQSLSVTYSPGASVQRALVVPMYGNFSLRLIWFDPSGRGWHNEVSGEINEIFGGRATAVPKLHASQWQPVTGLFPVFPFDPASNEPEDWNNFSGNAYNILNSEDELDMLLLAKDPEGYAYVQKKREENRNHNGIFSSASLLMAPQIRLLDHLGYRCISSDEGHEAWLPKEFVLFNQYFQPGDTEEEIVKLPKYQRDAYRTEALFYWPDVTNGI